jgi:hypothetical protein
MSLHLNLGASKHKTMPLGFQSLNLIGRSPLFAALAANNIIVYSSLNMPSCTVATNNIAVYFIPRYFEAN